MFNNQLLEAYIGGFYGYGSYGAEFWFIGMEEGGGGSREQIGRRLDAWDTRGRKELDDVVEYHREVGYNTKRFDERPKLGKTWSKLIRVLLSSRGYDPSQEQVRDYQKNRLARKNSDSCLVELLPLPSPGTNLWLYYGESTLPFLKDRKTYKEHVRPLRVAHLRRRIEEHQPRVVVFYSLTYLRYWEEVAGMNLHPAQPDGTRVGTAGRTIFVVTRHPVARGVTNEYFHAVGRMIGSQIRH
jgi:hypothetical protein